MKMKSPAVLVSATFLVLGAAAASFGYGGSYGRGGDLPPHRFGKAYDEVPVYRGAPAYRAASGYGGGFSGYGMPAYRESAAEAAYSPASGDSAPAPVYYELGESISLFNGVDLTGWTDKEGNAPNSGWQVQDGAICRAEDGAGSLYTAGEFDNFILEFDFKAARGANSGLKYRLWDQDGDVLGCEYQILDPEGQDHGDLHDTAALYDVIPAIGVRDLFKQDEFNHAKIVVKGNHIEHWFNGQRIVSVLVRSPQWNEGVAKSKFADLPQFGQNLRSRFFLQDHGDKVWFKNVTLPPLKPLR